MFQIEDYDFLFLVVWKKLKFRVICMEPIMQKSPVCFHCFYTPMIQTTQIFIPFIIFFFKKLKIWSRQIERLTIDAFIKNYNTLKCTAITKKSH